MNPRIGWLQLLQLAILLAGWAALAKDINYIKIGQDYLGQYTYFRGWSTRRRLIVVKTSDFKMDRILREAKLRYRCKLALRNVNLSKSQNI